MAANKSVLDYTASLCSKGQSLKSPPLRNSYPKRNTLLLFLPSIQQGTHQMIEYPDIRTETRHTARIWHKLTIHILYQTWNHTSGRSARLIGVSYHIIYFNSMDPFKIAKSM